MSASSAAVSGKGRMMRWLSLMVCLVLLVGLAPVAAQEGPDAWTIYDLNLRAGPGTTYAQVITLPPNTALIIEAHSEDLSWLLARTEDGSYRGWAAALYLRYRDGFTVLRLPVSAEILGAAPVNASVPTVDSASAARTVGTLNLRSGPGQSYSRLATLARNTPLALEARSADSTWLLVHTLDTTLRGWVFAAYLETTMTLADLPISEEGVTTENPGAPTNDFLNTIPVIPSIGPRAREIYEQGNANPRVFSKVGDCNSADWLFLSPFDVNNVDLGENSGLADTISFFSGSFSQSSAAAHVGFNAMTVIDASWANPQMCNAGESSVWCEYRLRHPAVSLIMFGANDVYNLSAEQYDQSLRQIVDWTIQAGAIPVLGTFAWCGTNGFVDKAAQLNTLTVNIAYEYGIPVINFWRAAQSLPNCGLASDGIHLSEEGFSLRSLITLQTLDEVRRNALY